MIRFDENKTQKFKQPPTNVGLTVEILRVRSHDNLKMFYSVE